MCVVLGGSPRGAYAEGGPAKQYHVGSARALGIFEVDRQVEAS